MYTIIDPDEFESVKVDDGQTCHFHMMNPGKPHPNICLRHGACGCSSPRYEERRRSLDDIAKIKAERQEKADDEILAKAELIRRKRLSSREPES